MHRDDRLDPKLAELPAATTKSLTTATPFPPPPAPLDSRRRPGRLLRNKRRRRRGELEIFAARQANSRHGDIPGDYRMRLDRSQRLQGDETIVIRAKVWGGSPGILLKAKFADRSIDLNRIEGSNAFEGHLTTCIEEGVYGLDVFVLDGDDKQAHDRVLVRIGRTPEIPRLAHDVENALDAWPDHGLLGTRLGPNRNGRKW